MSTVTPHPNATKEKAVRQHGEHDTRTHRAVPSGRRGSDPHQQHKRRAEQLIVTGVGLDRSAFPMEKHFASS